MPYTSNNWSLFSIYSDARWWKVRQLAELCNRLDRVNFSVVASRNEGLGALDNFEDGGIWGDSIFAVAKRFPNDIGDNYVCTAHGRLSDVINDLQMDLSWRPTNKAKDTETMRPGGGSRDRTAENEMLDQGCQDQTKAFGEHRKLLKNLVRDREEVFRQLQFEQRTSSTWSAGGEAGGAGVPDPESDDEAGGD